MTRPSWQTERRIDYLLKSSPTGLWLDSRTRLKFDLHVLVQNANALSAIARPFMDEAAVIDLWTNEGNGELSRITGEMHRLFANFLGATSALADHSRVHVRTYSAALESSYGAQVQSQMLETPVFHIVRSLRNEFQHTATPVAHPRYNEARQPDGSYAITHGWYLPKRWLLELRTDWPDLVKQFLDRALYDTGDPRRVDFTADAMGQNDVEAVWLAETYSGQALGLTEWLLNADWNLHRGDVVALAQAVRDLDAGLS